MPTEFSRIVLTYNVPILNTNHFISEIGNIICKDEPFAILWQVTKSGEVRVSFRSEEKGEDVSKIATNYGINGGGHIHASGTRFNNVQDFMDTLKFIDD